MRLNVYAEEYPTKRRVERVSTKAQTGVTYFGARIYLESADSLHDKDGDDDRSAITFWGPREKVAALLREAADAMDPRGTREGPDSFTERVENAIRGRS